MACSTPSAVITDISRADGNNLTDTFSMRYRKASDPDVDASYTPVLTTKTIFGTPHTLNGITYPYFDMASVEPDVYVVHTYATASGTGTGTKVTIEVTCEDSSGGGG